GLNSIPREAWLDLDLRSEDARALAQLDVTVRAALDRAADDENRRRLPGTPPLRAELRCCGDRPSGATPASHPLVQAALAATRALGREPELAAASTDANVPIALGIPAIALGAGGRGGDAHLPTEWYENDQGALDPLRLHQQPVPEARNHQPLAPAQSRVPRARHRGRVEHERRQREQPALGHAGAGLELGPHGPRTQRGHRHAAARQLFRQRFGERQHVRLGAVVHRHERPRLERGRGGHVEDRPAPPREHPRQQQLGQVGERHDVHLQQLQLGAQVRRRERPRGAEPRVVHEHVDREPHLLRRRDDLFGRLRRGEIRPDRPAADAVPPGKLPPQRFEPVRAARHQHQIVAVAREQPRQLEPDPARRARDQCGPAGCHGFAPVGGQWASPPAPGRPRGLCISNSRGSDSTNAAPNSRNRCSKESIRAWRRTCSLTIASARVPAIAAGVPFATSSAVSAAIRSRAASLNGVTWAASTARSMVANRCTSVADSAIPTLPPSWRIRLKRPVPFGIRSIGRSASARFVSGTKISPSPTPRRISGQKKSGIPLSVVKCPCCHIERVNSATPATIESRPSNLPWNRPMDAIVTALARAPGRITNPVCSAVKFWSVCKYTGSTNTVAYKHTPSTPPNTTPTASWRLRRMRRSTTGCSVVSSCHTNATSDAALIAAYVTTSRDSN